MNGLLVVSGKDVVRVLEKTGYERARQKGSHVAMVKRSPPGKTVTVPMHREIKVGLLRAILRQAEVSPEEFRRLLDE